MLQEHNQLKEKKNTFSPLRGKALYIHRYILRIYSFILKSLNFIKINNLFKEVNLGHGG